VAFEKIMQERDEARGRLAVMKYEITKRILNYETNEIEKIISNICNKYSN
jgi:hypothetical protein